MKTDFISRFGAFFMVFIFLSNDVAALTKVVAHGMPDFSNESTVYHPRGFAFKNTNENLVVSATDAFADGGHAYLGGHADDPNNLSSDDIFQLNLNLEGYHYQAAYLTYETKGLSNPNDLPKSINGGDVYGSENLELNPDWKQARVRIDHRDLRDGINHVRFILPQSVYYPVEVRDVRIELRGEGNDGLSTQSTIDRLPANTIDFEVINSEEVIGYASSRVEVAQIPSHIDNVTRGSDAYHISGSIAEGCHIAIGVDASKVHTHNDLNQVQVYYFDLLEGDWKRAHIIRVDHDKLRIEAMVPGETDYFAGLITAPEMPQANAFVPTNVSDIEPANPATGMRLIQPPSANRSGSAAVSYPLWIPQGRQGMTPRLSVNYNSDASSGWVGYGWSIPVSMFSVDTKWGVPTYSTSNESEGYVMDGTALFQEGGFRPNKEYYDGQGNLSVPTRQTGTVRYFPRVMNSYQEIERIGNDPSSYCWKVTDASNTIRYYGTLEGTGVHENAVLRDGLEGPIAQWYLAKVKDQWGNIIEYEYSHYSNTSSNTMASGGKGIYLSKITYTGHNSTSGKYTVHFNATGGRVDGSVRMNYGFKVIDDRTLETIDVKYDGTTIVQYAFQYSNSQSTLFKTLLTEIIENRGNPLTEFYKHTFEYHSGAFEYESTPEVLQISQDRSYMEDAPWYARSIINPLFAWKKPSAIQTSLNEGSSGHGGFGLGLSSTTMFGFLVLKEEAINLGLSGSRTNTTVVQRMQDFNGDGLPDILSDRGNEVVYRPMRRSNNGDLSIGSERDVLGIESFDMSRSSSIGFKVEFVEKGGLITDPYQVGLNYSRTRSDALRSIIDYNADGFPDLLNRENGTSKVLFGGVDQQGTYTFNGSSENTANPVLRGESVVTPPDDDFSKPMEVVRVWKAFETGEVRVTGAAEIMSGATGTVDIALQHNSTFVGGTFKTVTPGLSGKQSYNEYINVQKGDVLIFRTRSGDDSQGDALKWNPIINYTASNYYDGQNTPWGFSSAQAAYMLSSPTGVSFSGDKQFRVNMNSFTNTTTLSDDVNLFIDVYVNGVHSTTYSETLSEGTTGSPSNTFAPFILGNPTLSNYYTWSGTTSSDIITLQLRVASSSNVRWNAMRWMPIVEFEQDCDDPIEFLYPVPDFHTYNTLEEYGSGTNLGTLTTGVNYQIIPEITLNATNLHTAMPSNELTKDILYMTVKYQGGLAQKIAIEFDATTGSEAIRFKTVDMSANLDPNDPSFVGSTTLSKTSFNNIAGTYFDNTIVQGNCMIEFFGKGAYAEALIDYVQNHLTSLSRYPSTGTKTTISSEGVSYYWRNSIDELNIHYKHWGVFAWAPLDGEENFAIDPADLHFPLNSQASQPSTSYNMSDVENNPGNYNPQDFEFWSLLAIRGEDDRDLWDFQDDLALSTRDLDHYGMRGLHLGSYRTLGGMFPMILGEADETNPDPTLNLGTTDPVYSAEGALSRGRSHSLSVNGGAGKVSGAVTFSEPLLFYSRQLTSFTDFNGDGYPDVLADDDGIQGQFTSQLGGYGTQVLVSNLNVLNKGTSAGAQAAWAGSYSNQNKRFAVSGNVSGSMTFSKSRTTNADINGDGLPDAYDDDILNDEFRLNTGYGFEAQSFPTSGTIRNQSYTLGFSGTGLVDFAGSFSKSVRSISGGLNVNLTGSYSEKAYFDLNGDGLTDYIKFSTLTSPNDEVYINTGDGFMQYNIANNDDLLPDAGPRMGESGSTGLSAQVSLTFGPIINFIKLPINGGYGDNFALNRVEASFMDMNGDGAPDFIEARSDGNLNIYYAKFGKLNKLKSVSNPLGGEFTIEYEVIGNKRGYFDPIIPGAITEEEQMLWDMPLSKWVMSSVTVFDGVEAIDGSQQDLDGEDYFTTTFAYDGGIRSRREREFFGFTRVGTYTPDMMGSHERDDHCASSSDFEVEQSNNIEFPTGSGTFYQSSVPTNSISRYNVSVQAFQAPAGLSHDDQKKFLYESSKIHERYSLHIHEWDEEIIDVAGIGTLTWNRFHSELLTHQIFEYQNRVVATNTSYQQPLGQVVYDEQATEDWRLLEEEYTSATLPETATIFPAVTETFERNYPVVEDRQNVNLQKFHIEYDEYFNVVIYDDYGTLLEANWDTIPVDTIEVGKYVYHEQSNTINCPPSVPGTGMTITQVDSEHYYVTVESTEPGYEDAVIWGLYPSITNCGEYGYTGPLSGCTTSETSTFNSVHRKWVLEEYYIYEIIDNSTYNRRIIAKMDYFEPPSANDRTNALEEHRIYVQNTASQSNIRRFTRVESLYNGKAPLQIGNYLSGSPTGAKALTNMTYDSYGNVLSVTSPENHAAQRLTTSFTYDTDVHQFVERVDNDYNDFSCTIYDYGFQHVLQSTGINGHSMRYVYDDNQRLIHIWAPREMNTPANGPTISFDYQPFKLTASGDPSPLAYTYHNTGNLGTTVTMGASGTTCPTLVDISTWTATMASSVGTATFTDGTDRVIQIQTEVDWDDPTNSVHTMATKTRVSGWAEVDRFGVQVLGRNDYLAADTEFGTLQFTDSEIMQQTTYDYLHRPVLQESRWSEVGGSDGEWSISKITRDWATLSGSTYYRETTSIGQNAGAQTFKAYSRVYYDHKGRTVGQEQEGGTWAATLETTSFDFDDLGQLNKVTAPTGEETSYTYDFFGRQTIEEHPDRGKTTTTYDNMGNVVSIQTPGTQQHATNGVITFDHNYARVIERTLPSTSPNADLYDVKFAYGSRGDGLNGAGRVVKVTQGTATNALLIEDLVYDELGNVVEQNRDIRVPQVGVQSYDMLYRYDSFGRALRITYPDDEIIDYDYSDLGSLIAIDVTSTRCTGLPNIIDEISYDGYDNIVYMKYGNGSETDFGYHSETRALLSSTVTAIPSGYAKQEVMDRQYTYNDLGMISQSEITPHRRFISSSSKLTTTFTYDGLMRLENATTSISNIAISGPEPGTPPVTYQTYNGTLYDVDMEYSSGGRVLSKDSNPNSAMAAIADGNLEYDYTVSYGGQSDHQVKSISEVTASGTATSNFTYNLSGSITSIERTLGASTKGSIDYVWNEEQWLVADSNELGIHHYVYDYNGERIMKSSFEVYSAWINDDLIQSTATLQSYTVYANPYEVVSYYDDNGTMEDITSYHYYMGMQRVASGRFADQVQQGMSSKMEGSSSSTNELSEPDPVITQFIGILDEFGYHEGEDFTREELETMESLSNVYPEYSSSTNKTGTSTDNQSNPNLTQEGLNEGPIEEFCEGVETKVYWYHPNYLGSVDLITDIYGEVHQYFLYTPWGESLHQYDAQANGFDSPYRFNGKELDEETGLAYYGARYYDNQLSTWLSVDPLAHEYRSLSPYTFVANNPISLVDPDGRHIDVVVVENEDGTRTVNVTLTGKVIDLSERQIVAYQDVGVLNRELSELYSGTYTADDGTEVTVNFTANYTLAESIDDIGGDDHVMAVVDELGPGNYGEDGGEVDPAGLAEIYGNVAMVEAGYWTRNDWGTAKHEVGHNLGLEHIAGTVMNSTVSSSNRLTDEQRKHAFTRFQWRSGRWRNSNMQTLGDGDSVRDFRRALGLWKVGYNHRELRQ